MRDLTIVVSARVRILQGRPFEVDEALVLDACERVMLHGSQSDRGIASGLHNVITRRAVNQINRRGRQIADVKSALTLALVTYALVSLVVGALEQLF